MVMPGVVLGGRYRIDDLLGRGAIAEVYRGFDQVLARSVAVKIFHPGVTNQLNVAGQRAEMQVLANLQHPNLLSVYDARFGDSPVAGAPPASTDEAALTYKVMELVDGGTLANRIVPNGMPSGEVARVGAAAASGLAAVHQFGLVHRDIRPANILLSAAGEVKLSDFGFARELEAGRIASTADVAGSTAFLSPEQARGAVIGPPSDVYSLGLVLLECLTGHREYPGAAVESAIARLTRNPVVPDYLPGSWPALLRAMTAPDPAQRPTAAQVAATLAGFGAIPAVQPPRAPLPQPVSALPAPTPPARHDDHAPASFGRIVGVVLLVLVVTAGIIVGTVAVVRNNEGKQGTDNPPSTTLTISRGATSVVTTTERTTETSREVIAPTLPTRTTSSPTTPTIPPATAPESTEQPTSAPTP
jgi:serine/threonine protein kinase